MSSQDMETDTLVITAQEAGTRLDKILASRFENIKSRTYFQMLIEDGDVLVNSHKVKKRFLPDEGDEVEIYFALTPELELVPEAIPLSIVYEDEHLLAINKPVGMVVHPAPGNWSGTFVNALLHHCNDLDRRGTLRPGIVHRLDKETSGLLLAAKTALAQQRLIEMFASRTIYKEYLAICVGNPGDREINAPIGRHPIHRQQMAVLDAKGREAHTIIQTVNSSNGLSLLRVNLLTGRTHQIRVHLKHIGHPVLGDRVYGNPGLNQKFHVQRQLLHAAHLYFKHPITQQELSLFVEPPQDFKAGAVGAAFS